jgi:hypothetical protein
MKFTYSAYVVKFNEKKFRNAGFQLMAFKDPDFYNVYWRYKKFSKKSELVNFMFNYYQTEEWQNSMIHNEKRINYYEEKLGFKFKKLYDPQTNELIELQVYKNKKAYEFSQLWEIGIDLKKETPTLYLTHMCIFPEMYHHSAILDKYCPSVVERLLNEGLIEKEYLTADVENDEFVKEEIDESQYN